MVGIDSTGTMIIDRLERILGDHISDGIQAWIPPYIGVETGFAGLHGQPTSWRNGLDAFKGQTSVSAAGMARLNA
jgi:hypothetical protein